MDEKNYVLLNHICRRLLVFEENISRLNSELAGSEYKLVHPLGQEGYSKEKKLFKIESVISSVPERENILELLSKLETLEVELVEIRMLYFSQLNRFDWKINNLLRSQLVRILKKAPPLFHILKKVRGFYILKKSRDLYSKNRHPSEKNH